MLGGPDLNVGSTGHKGGEKALRLILNPLPFPKNERL